MGETITVELDAGTEEPAQESTETGNQEGTPTEAQNQEGTPTEAKNQEKDAQTQTNDGDDDGTEGKPINQEAVNKKIAKVVARRKEAEAKAEAEKKRADELEAKLKEKEPTVDEIVIPDLPDAYDPEYESKLAERDAAIQEKAIAKAKAEQAERDAQEAIEQQQIEARKRYEDQTTKMYETGEKVGIKKDDLQQAEQTLSLFIKDAGLAQFILAHEDSALIVNYLAQDVETLEKISSMPGTNAAVHVATQVLPEAKKFKPSVTKTPDPLDIPEGKAAGNEDPYLKGVQFE